MDTFPAHRFSVAPMMERTDPHFRAIVRGLTHRALLYTEMIATYRPVQGLALPPDAGPTVLQLGGADPVKLAAATRQAADWGYTEVNLNCGCPSSAASEGEFGARLMLSPKRVAACVAAMRGATSLPVTVKHRLGVDDTDTFEALEHFVDTVAGEGGASGFIVHGRKAWLRGLSPKQNRTVPPLRPAWVYRLKVTRPSLRIEYNGGVLSVDAVTEHLAHGVDGVMVGRAAYDDPWMLARVDAEIFGEPGPAASRTAVFEHLANVAEQHVASGGAAHDVVRHGYGFLRGFGGAKRARRALSEAGRGLTVKALRRVLGGLSLPQHDAEPALLPRLEA